MSYKILAIDGGGIRGAFAVQILKMLEEEMGFEFINEFDCFAGTSTGALIISAMNSGYSVKKILRYYCFLGSYIFPNGSHKRERAAKYSNQFLAKVMRKLLPENPTLDQLEKDIIIPSCKLFDPKVGRWNTSVYDNYNEGRAKRNTLIDAALRSAAAPIYFASYQKHVDGGLYALNPSLIALSRAIDSSGGKKKLEDVKIFSIGNGINPEGIHEEVNWGASQWMSPYRMVAKHPLFSMMTEMGAIAPDYPLEQILQDRYRRINTLLPKPIEMDDTKEVKTLIRAAKKYRENNPDLWKSHKDWICTHVL